MSIRYGTYTIQGNREYQEDKISVVSLNLLNIEKCSLIILCDGHSGDFCSIKTCEILPKIILNKLKNISKYENSNSIINLLRKSIYEMDLFFEKMNENSGSTCVFCLFLNSKLFIGNIGDSRCIIGNIYNKIIYTTIDHKPNNINEKLRIESNGGYVLLQDTYRVYINNQVGGLAISRVFGDIPYKIRNIVSCEADIVLKNIITSNEIIILASDGLWDVLSNEDVLKFVNARLNKYRLTEISKQLVNYAYYIGSMDNITVILAKIKDDNIIGI